MALKEINRATGFQPSQERPQPRSGRAFAPHMSEARRQTLHDLLPDGGDGSYSLLREAECAEHEHSSRKHRGRRPRRLAFAMPIAMLSLASVATGFYLNWDNARHFETAHGADLAGRQFDIAPNVSGYITSVPVTDNEHVAGGTVVARIDNRDYQISLEQAQAEMAVAQANIESIDAQIAVEQTQLARNDAQVEQVQASLAFTQQQAARYETLARTGASTVQNAQQWALQLHLQKAALKNAQAALVAAAHHFATLHAQRNAAAATLAQETAQRDQAKLNLFYTAVTAPQPGHVAKLSASVGRYVSAGTSLTNFVVDPAPSLYARLRSWL